ncbi:hypothetical protein HIM_02074 [Hirsutella minnesotensis 3608]|nr:hypothetical protein HIM_02074 [Hirsutella minnesotensis 3608]
MLRIALRSASPRAASSVSRASLRCAPRRFVSTSSPADKPRSWKSSALRWGLAAAAVYYYNTSSIFAEEVPEPNALIPAPSPFAESELPTVETVVEEKRKQLKSKSAPEPAKSKEAAAESDELPQSKAQPSLAATGSPEALEEEAGQEGAFNPETGEINWDCPCLGGMAHGPCGEEFKAAFSCFVYSTEEPKGMDCIEKFQGMQECFRKYPDIYGAELADDDMPEDDMPATPEPVETDHQMLRESPAPAKPEDIKPEDNKPETHNLPGVRPVEEAELPPWEDATRANNDKGEPELEKGVEDVKEQKPKATKEHEQKKAVEDLEAPKPTTQKEPEKTKAEEDPKEQQHEARKEIKANESDKSSKKD